MNSKTALYPLTIVDAPEIEATNENVQSPAISNADITLDIVSIDEWDNLVSGFDDFIPEQTGTFINSHWGHKNTECVTVQKRGKLIGGAALIVRKLPFSTTGMAILKWGPAWCRQGFNRDEEDYRTIVQALIAEYCTKRNLHLTIMPAAFPNLSEITCGSLRFLGFKTGNVLAAPERYIVNTDQSPEELMASLDQKWRYNLRKANKNEFDIRFADDEQGLEAFLELYATMIGRKQFLDSSAIGSLRQIMEKGVEAIRPKIVLVSHEGNITAGGIFSMAGNMANYMFGASDYRALRLKAGYAMHWWVAEYMCNQENTKWYDLGGNDLDTGLHQFKKGFVGKTGQILEAPARYHYAASTIAELAGNTVFRLRDGKAAATRMIHKVKKRIRK